MSQQRDQLADLRAENARLRERIENLEGELADLREKRVNDLEWIGRLDEDVERINEAHATAESVQTEQRTRSQADAKLERKIEMLAEAVDVDLTDSAVMGEDRLTRLLRYGPEDITDNPTKAHHRARCLLSFIGTTVPRATTPTASALASPRPRLASVSGTNATSGSPRTRSGESLRRSLMSPPTRRGR